MAVAVYHCMIINPVVKSSYVSLMHTPKNFIKTEKERKRMRNIDKVSVYVIYCEKATKFLNTMDNAVHEKYLCMCLMKMRYKPSAYFKSSIFHHRERKRATVALYKA